MSSLRLLSSCISQSCVAGLLWLGQTGGVDAAIAHSPIPHSSASSPTDLAQQPGLCPAQLGSTISAVVRRPAFQRARWGILVQTLSPSAVDRLTLYALEAQRYFTPASTVKLMTTAAALRQLGPQFRIRTSVYQVNAASGQTALWVVGRGDPSFEQDDLTALVQQIRDRGIQQVDQLFADDHYFQGSTVHPNWEWEDVQAGYGAPATSLILNQNELVFDLFPQALGQPLRVEWRDSGLTSQWQIENRSVTVAATEPEFVQVGRDISRSVLTVAGQLRVGSDSEDASISVPSPAQHFLQQLQQSLTDQQIEVAQTQLAVQPLGAAGSEIAAIASPPLSELLIETNQQSNNIYAEALLKQVGHHYYAAIPEQITDSTAAGLDGLQAALADLGVDSNSYRLVDGSGLSRQNLVSPEALVDTLQGMAHAVEADTYRASLAVAGVSGTLQYRFQDTAVEGQLQGKSGTLSDNAALAGYLDPPNYPPLAFSIFVNQTNLSGREMRTAIDDIVLLLAQLKPCGS